MSADRMMHRIAYEQAFRELVAATPSVAVHDHAGREFLYRPGELLFASEDADRVMEALRGMHPQAMDGASLFDGECGTLLLRMHPGADVPAIVSSMRDARIWGDQPYPAIQPNHVTMGYAGVYGHPALPPLPATRLPPIPDRSRAHVGRGVTVCSCDTGIWERASGEHPEWFEGSYRPQPDDIDGLAAPHRNLAFQAGHGTFVGGIIRTTAPGVSLDPEVVLEPSGLGDELMLAAALAAVGPGVEIVSLSLGFLTMDDVPSLPIARALRGLGREVVVVAAAGNSGSQRPHWPAAYGDVMGVAALTEGGNGTLVPDPDSSHGSWVDACALGTHTSTYVRGDLQLPGVDTLEFDPPYASWSGTSFAAAFVAGRLAGLMTEHSLSGRLAGQKMLDHPRWMPEYGVLVS